MEYSLSKATDKAMVDSLAENKSKGGGVNMTLLIITVVVLFSGAVWLTQRRR
jgi:hypothetical protein